MFLIISLTVINSKKILFIYLKFCYFKGELGKMVNNSNKRRKIEQENKIFDSKNCFIYISKIRIN